MRTLLRNTRTTDSLRRYGTACFSIVWRRAFAACALQTIFVALSCCSLWAADYNARIRRTSYGIAHIDAKDVGSLGFGDGYAQAEDHLCSIADQIVKARGERSKYFGRGRADDHFNSDVTARALDLTGAGLKEVQQQSREIADWLKGWVAGYNRYLAVTGKDKVAGWCRGADWVFPITLADLAGHQRSLALVSAQYAQLIATAAPPSDGKPVHTGSLAPPIPQIEAGASNGWALGRDKTESGRGMLIANPHYPWVGSNRFWEKHLTVPGYIDVYGVSLVGMPDVAIGFNKDVGWTHTVSAGKRIALYTLDLVPGRPTVYKYGNAERPMTSKTVTIAVRQNDGSVMNVAHQVWFSHYGPILNFPGAGWTAQRTIAIRDANEGSEGRLGQHTAMGRAKNLREFQDAHAKYQGTMWVNTITATREGTAWYVDMSATPKLSGEAIAEWMQRRVTDPLTKRMYEQGGNALLDGSDPRFEFQTDPAARAPGSVSYKDVPKIERTDYVFNSNDSFWIANSHADFSGAYSPLHGEQRTPRSLRTRNNDITLDNKSPDQPAGGNQKFSLDEMANALLSNRSLGGELLRDQLVSRCRQQPSMNVDGKPVDLKPACDALAGWNLRNDLESRGAVLFKEFMGRYEGLDLARKGKLWAVDFDAANPVSTPHTLADGPLALENLARAALLMQSQKLAPDVKLGDVQYADKAGKRIPIHGGDGAYDGLMNMQRNGRNTTTLEPMDNPPQVKGSRFLTEKGYPVVHGSSFIMALEFTDQGPRAKAFLTYGQSGDPASPHFTDQTELFAKKQWRPVLFKESDIKADVKREYRVRGPRS